MLEYLDQQNLLAHWAIFEENNQPWKKKNNGKALLKGSKLKHFFQEMR